MSGWAVERIVSFGNDDFVIDGLAHFGFHVRDGHYYAIAHPRHFLALVGDDGLPAWTVAARPVFKNVPNIAAELDYPMFADALPDGTLVVSNLGNARLYRIDPRRMRASLLVDGHSLGMIDMGNCVVDDAGSIWVNEVTGCRVWRFDSSGHVLLVLGDGQPGFDAQPTTFEKVRFNWIYDLRRGPSGRMYVLDSRNYALRVVAPDEGCVMTIAGGGTSGYRGDGGAAREATFGSDPSAQFDGPISLALDEDGNAYVGDRYNHVVRAITAEGTITTIAGRSDANDEESNDPSVSDPRHLNLPQISSLDYSDGRLFVPTDLDGAGRDLAVLTKNGAAQPATRRRP
jgi:hypothetical protein